MKSKSSKSQKKKRKTGLPPGTINYTGDNRTEPVFVHFCQFDTATKTESTFKNNQLITLLPSNEEKVDWYDVRGLHNNQLIESLGKSFGIHPLILEDAVDIYQRPKYEEYEKGISILVKALSFDAESISVKKEQVGIYFKKGLIITFQEHKTDLLIPIRQRIENVESRIRKRGADYLAYTILDLLVDNYFIVLEEIEKNIENIEEQLLEKPELLQKEKLHHLKKELLTTRRSVAPLREAINKFSKTDNLLIEQGTHVFVRDLYDHTIQIMEMIDTHRDVLNGLQDLYLSEISYRMNQVMQILTIITTIFVPLSFLAGLYGMNFEHMPELRFRYGYFILLGVMFLIFISSLFYFKKKNWF